MFYSLSSTEIQRVNMYIVSEEYSSLPGYNSSHLLRLYNHHNHIYKYVEYTTRRDDSKDH